MPLPFRFAAVLSVAVLACGSSGAQPRQVAPPPHLPLSELAKEYKRLGLPLPPKDAELVRVKWDRDTPPHLAFRLPAKPGDDPQYLIGSSTYDHYPPGERVKNAADALRDVEPGAVAELLCVAAQCHTIGLNEIAEAVYARAREAIAKPVPPVWARGQNQFGGGMYRVNGWGLYVEDETRSAHLELRHEAFAYWHGKIMVSRADRREVLRYLQATNFGFHRDVRDLERTVAPRKSKPGTAESLIDDLTEWRTWDDMIRGEDFSGDLHPGEAAYWKLAEMGFDAIPALLEHMQDSRFTRHPEGERDYTGFRNRLTSPTRVGHLARSLVNHFAGDFVIGAEDDPREEDARAWWEKARKVGEEKWLVANALPEPRDDLFAAFRQPSRVIFRALGAKYPARLAEVYRTALRERTGGESRVLALEIVASKLLRAEKLALLEEGAEHRRLVHRNAALAVLARFDAPTFRKHLLATLKEPPPNVQKVRGLGYPQAEFAFLVWQTADSACWESLTAFTKTEPAEVRVEILREFRREWTEPDERPLFRLAQRPEPNSENARRKELLRFLLRFLSDDSVAKGDDSQPDECVQDVAAVVLGSHVGFKLNPYIERGPLSRLFVRAAVAKAAAEELARLTK